MTKIKVGIVGAIVVAAVVTPVVLHYQSQAKLRAAEESARQQTAQLANAQTENDRLASLAAQAGSSKAQSNELLALRARAAAFGRQTNELPKLPKENRRLQAAQSRPTVEPTPEQQQAVETRMNYGKRAIMVPAWPQVRGQHDRPSLPAQRDAEQHGDGRPRPGAAVEGDRKDMTFYALLPNRGGRK